MLEDRLDPPREIPKVFFNQMPDDFFRAPISLAGVPAHRVNWHGIDQRP
jgi:hypothetical protein